MVEQLETAGVPGLPEALREQLHRAGTICGKIENLNAADGEAFDSLLSECKAEFTAIADLPPEYAEIVGKRFENAVKNAEEVGENIRKEAAALEVRRSAAAGKVESYRKALDKFARVEILAPKESEIRSLEKNYRECVELLGAGYPGLEGFEEAFAIFYARIAAEEKANAEKTATVDQFVAELSALTAGEDMKLLHDRKSAVEIAYSALSAVPKAAADAYKKALHDANVRLSQHYETLDLARWESYTLKLELCAELEKLQNVPDAELPAAAKTLREMREKWKNLGAVPKAKFDEINPRYLELTRTLQHRIDEHFAKLRQVHKEAAAAKRALCEKAAALAPLTDWNTTSAAFKALQAEWKTLPGAGPEERELYANFRASADLFFNARSAYFDQRNQKFDQIAETKRALVVEAEKLMENPTPDATRIARDLRARYQAAGGAGKQELELSKAFNAALDKIFNARRAEFAERENQSRALIAEIQQLTESMTDLSAENRYREICRNLKELACRQTFPAETAARKLFEEKLTVLRERQLNSRFELYSMIAPKLADLFRRVKSGETVAPEEFEVSGVEIFPKLQNVIRQLAAAATGDGKALEKLEKTQHHAISEQERICDELEKLAGVTKSGKSAGMSLADELAAAIAGNFGAGAVRAEKPADPKQLLSEYIAVAVLDAEKLAVSLKRFGEAYGKLCGDAME